MRLMPLFLILILVSQLSACGGKSSNNTSTELPAPAAADTLSATNTLADQSGITSTSQSNTKEPGQQLASTTPMTIDTDVPTYQPTVVLATPANLDREFGTTDEFQQKHEYLVTWYIEPAVEDERIIAAMQTVPRHSFIPTEYLYLAYEDHPLPLGYGQTISQPSLVAIMTEILEIEEGDNVLEIGTGSGYQAAILGQLTHNVYSVEIIPELSNISRAVLDELGYDYIQTDRRDGYFGWEEYAPFDAIIVTAAPDHLPRPLVNQLNPDGGRMVIPIGPVGNVQTLWLVIRHGDEIEMQQLAAVQFVPFTRDD
jgi:protein-L-isoaspartate(D-aspartate) O-methyltransferase